MANDAMAEVDELKKRLTQNPDSLIFVPLADAYRKAGLLQEAIDVCTKGLEKHPTYMSARVVLGRIYEKKDMLNEAVDELKKVEAVDVDNIMVHSMLGNVYLKKKMYAEAVEQFQKVLSLNPEDTESQEKLTEALSAKQAPAAEAKHEAPKKTEAPKPAQPKAQAVNSPEPKAEAKQDDVKLKIANLKKAAELFTEKEEFDKAIEKYEIILKQDPNNLEIEEKLRAVYGYQDKKLAKQKQKNSEPSNEGGEDKITTEDIFDVMDVMKKAVEDDAADDKPAPAAQKKEAPKPEADEFVGEDAPEPQQTVKVEPAKAKLIEQVLMDLAGVEGVVGSFFLLRNGTIVASVLPKSINSGEIGNIIASIVEKTEASVRNMNQGKLNQVVISSESGQLLFTEVMTGVLFMIGNSQINVGKMRLILKDVIDNIKSVLS